MRAVMTGLQTRQQGFRVDRDQAVHRVIRTRTSEDSEPSLARFLCNHSLLDELLQPCQGAIPLLGNDFQELVGFPQRLRVQLVQTLPS